MNLLYECHYSILTGEGYCPAIWDGYTCFNKAQAGSVQHEACPSFMYSTSPPTCQRKSLMCTSCSDHEIQYFSIGEQFSSGNVLITD